MQCNSNQIKLKINANALYMYLALTMFLNTRPTRLSINARVWVKAYCRGSWSLVDTGIYRPMLLQYSGDCCRALYAWLTQ